MRKSIPTPTTETPAPDAVALPSISSLPSLPPIPEGWEAKAAMVDQCIGAGKQLKLWIAMLVAEGRDDFTGKEGPSRWIAACTSRWGWDKPYLHHMNAVGKLLLRPMPGVQHAALCELEYEKVSTITRLPDHLVGPFIEKARPQDLSRDEVRTHVDLWLRKGGEPTGKPVRPTRHIAAVCKNQMTFLDTLFAADDAATRSMASDPVPARKTAVGGLVLLNVAILKYDKLDSAEKIADLEEILDEMEKQEGTLRKMLSGSCRRLLAPESAAPQLSAPAGDDGEEF